VQYCIPMIETSRQAAVELLTRCPEITAIFCHNDLCAVGAVRACQELGRAVPDDVAVIGYDDILPAMLITPSLTTISVPRYELGRLAGEMILSQINGQLPTKETILPVELVIRASAP